MCVCGGGGAGGPAHPGGRAGKEGGHLPTPRPHTNPPPSILLPRHCFLGVCLFESCAPVVSMYLEPDVASTTDHVGLAQRSHVDRFLLRGSLLWCSQTGETVELPADSAWALNISAEGVAFVSSPTGRSKWVTDADVCNFSLHYRNAFVIFDHKAGRIRPLAEMQAEQRYLYDTLPLATQAEGAQTSTTKVGIIKTSAPVKSCSAFFVIRHLMPYLYNDSTGARRHSGNHLMRSLWANWHKHAWGRWRVPLVHVLRSWHARAPACAELAPAPAPEASLSFAALSALCLWGVTKKKTWATRVEDRRRAQELLDCLLERYLLDEVTVPLVLRLSDVEAFDYEDIAESGDIELRIDDGGVHVRAARAIGLWERQRVRALMIVAEQCATLTDLLIVLASNRCWDDIVSQVLRSLQQHSSLAFRSWSTRLSSDATVAAPSLAPGARLDQGVADAMALGEAMDERSLVKVGRRLNNFAFTYNKLWHVRGLQKYIIAQNMSLRESISISVVVDAGDAGNKSRLLGAIADPLRREASWMAPQDHLLRTPPRTQHRSTTRVPNK